MSVNEAIERERRNLNKSIDDLAEFIEVAQDRIPAGNSATYDAQREIADLTAKLAASEAAAAAMRQALAWTQLFREFSDEWHRSDNPDVVRFRALRKTAISSDAGQSLLDELAALRTWADAAKAFITPISKQWAERNTNAQDQKDEAARVLAAYPKGVSDDEKA